MKISKNPGRLRVVLSKIVFAAATTALLGAVSNQAFAYDHRHYARYDHHDYHHGPYGYAAPVYAPPVYAPPPPSPGVNLFLPLDIRIH